jgi:hypothetical protein
VSAIEEPGSLPLQREDESSIDLAEGAEFLADGSQACEPNPENAALAGLLRCIFPNPFRPLPVIDPCWLAWNDRTITRLAEAVHAGASDERPILADALVDAGCADLELLAHLRRSDTHVKGCWVIDLLLGKK